MSQQINVSESESIKVVYDGMCSEYCFTIDGIDFVTFKTTKHDRETVYLDINGTEPQKLINQSDRFMADMLEYAEVKVDSPLVLISKVNKVINAIFFTKVSD